MADKRKAVGGGQLTHTLHVWPADELIAQSAYWPAWWYPAYERAARQLADRVACCILGGLPDCPEPIRMELQPSGSLTFSVQLWGTTIEVLIRHFEGPDDPEPDTPGPDGGVRQRPADGLVLGLRGSGKEFSVAPFYDGLVPPVPVGRGGRLRPWTVRIVTATSWVGAEPRMAPARPARTTDGGRHTASIHPRWLIEEEPKYCTMHYAQSAKKQTAISSQRRIKIEMRRSLLMNGTLKELRALLPSSYPGPAQFSSERPAACIDAFSDPICRSALPDREMRRGKLPFEGGASPRLN